MCRDVIRQRLVEVLLIEAVRVHAAPPLGGRQRGLIAGLCDPALAPALHQMHADIARGWTVEQLARAAAVSRVVFAQRLPAAWACRRCSTSWVALAKDLLRTDRLSTAQVAGRVGRLPVRQCLHHRIHPGHRMLSTEFARRPA